MIVAQYSTVGELQSYSLSDVRVYSCGSGSRWSAPASSQATSKLAVPPTGSAIRLSCAMLVAGVKPRKILHIGHAKVLPIENPALRGTRDMIVNCALANKAGNVTLEG